MSRDQMQDVFPISFDFKKGEQPQSNKFTNWVRQENTAFSRVTQAIGDTWDTQQHIHSLSPENLSITSLSRIIGPSDWLSPHGSSWNETAGSGTVITLYPNRNTWCIGFPLVKTITNINTTSTVGSSVVPCVWGTDITISSSSAFTTRKTNLEDVTGPGDYHVDFYTGIITSYSVITSSVYITINTINMFGAGVPWGTGNVIPSWDDSNLCYVSLNSTVGSTSIYDISLGVVSAGTRSDGSLYCAKRPESVDGFRKADGVFSTRAPGIGAKYRLPYSLTKSFSAGEEIPEGYMYLWGKGGRIIPQVTFYYVDENNIRVHTPVGWLEEGNTVRILVPGTSITEAVNWLLNSTRSNRHIGLTGGQDNKTLAYTAPISHASLTEMYGGDMETSYDVDLFTYVKSKYPANYHPQYLHRSGYLEDDVETDGTGNTGNAMRGMIVFSREDNYLLGESSGGLNSETYGVQFGGGDIYCPTIKFEGGSSGTSRFPFGIANVGIIPDSYTDRFGALTITNWRHGPIYLKCSAGASASGGEYASGPSIAFDHLGNNEMNYIKLLPGSRASTYDVPHLPIQMSSSVSWSSPLPTSPTLAGRMAPDGFREWRFRSVGYVPSSLNEGITSGSAYNHYFTGPGIVGADYLNLYSNAIFFSEEGDGIKTSFNTRINWFYDNTSSRPTGIYYDPGTMGGLGALKIYLGDNTGDDQKSTYVTSRYSSVLSAFNSSGTITSSISLSAGGTNIELRGYSGDISLDTEEDIYLKSNNNIYLRANAIITTTGVGTLGEENIYFTTENISSPYVQGDNSIILNTGTSSINWADNCIQIRAGNRIAGYSPVVGFNSNPNVAIEAYDSISLNVSNAYLAGGSGVLAKVQKDGFDRSSGYNIVPDNSTLWHETDSGKDIHLSLSLSGVEIYAQETNIRLETITSGNIILDSVNNVSVTAEETTITSSTASLYVTEEYSTSEPNPRVGMINNNGTIHITDSGEITLSPASGAYIYLFNLLTSGGANQIYKHTADYGDGTKTFLCIG